MVLGRYLILEYLGPQGKSLSCVVSGVCASDRKTAEGAYCRTVVFLMRNKLWGVGLLGLRVTICLADRSISKGSKCPTIRCLVENMWKTHISCTWVRWTYGRLNKSGVQIKIPNSRALILRTPNS